jgi:hypothetical protein
MMGLVFVPFFGASLAKQGRVLLAATMCLPPLLIVAAIMGDSHGGLAAFGPWLFVPVAMGMGCGVLTALPPWARIAGGLACFLEQALVVWLAIYMPHHGPFPAGHLMAPLRLFGLIALQAVAAVIIIVASRPRTRSFATRFAGQPRAIRPPEQAPDLTAWASPAFRRLKELTQGSDSKSAAA